MTTLFPHEYAVVLIGKDILAAIRLEQGTVNEVIDLATDTAAAKSGDEFTLRFKGAMPARVKAEVADKDNKKNPYIVTLGAADLPRAGTPRRIDPTRPFLLVIAGILASSVAILVGTFAAISGKDAGGPLQGMLTEVMAWMAAVVLASTLAAIALQVGRVLWMWLRADELPRQPLVRAVALGLCIVVTALPVPYGLMAARAAVSGGLKALCKPVPWGFDAAMPIADQACADAKKKVADTAQPQPAQAVAPPAGPAAPATPQ